MHFIQVFLFSMRFLFILLSLLTIIVYIFYLMLLCNIMATHWSYKGKVVWYTARLLHHRLYVKHFYLVNIVVTGNNLKPSAVFWSMTTSFQFFGLLLKIHTYDWQLLQKNPDEMTIRHNALLPSCHFQCRSLCEVALVWLQTLNHTECSVELWLLGCC